MRRVSMLALLILLLSSCFYRPVFVDPSSMGGLRPKLSQPRSGAQVCREVRRVKCDKVNCGADGRDLVTLNCAAGELTRCEIGKGGC
jgi:hypothetical protein